MTAEPQQGNWTLGLLLDLFDVEPDGPDRFIGKSGHSAGDDERQVVEGTQVLAQAIVAAAKRFPDKSVRSVHAVFTRAVLVGPPIVLDVDVVSEGRSTATAIITASQSDKRCMTFTVFTDVPTPDVIRHHLPKPDVVGPGGANACEMPMAGRQVRIVDVVDINSPTRSARPRCTPGCTTSQSRRARTWPRR